VAGRWGRSAGTLAWMASRGGGGQYPPRDNGDGHIRGYPVVGDPPHGNTGGGPYENHVTLKFDS
jgi:hypothetical protein